MKQFWMNQGCFLLLLEKLDVFVRDISQNHLTKYYGGGGYFIV